MASPVDAEAELAGWRQMAARSLSSVEHWRNRVVAYQVLRFWEWLGFIGMAADLAMSVRFYQEQVEIALELR